MDQVSYDELRKNTVRLLNDGHALSALPLTEILCELGQDSEESLTLRAQTLFEVREFDNVIRVVQKMSAAGHENSECLLCGMKAAFELGEIKQCLVFGETLMGVNKNIVAALCYMAKCAELSGEVDKAVELYKRALETDPFCGEAMNALIDRKLVSQAALSAVVKSLKLPPGGEVLRRSYNAKLRSKTAAFSPGVNLIDEDIVTGVPQKHILLSCCRREYELNNLRQALSISSQLMKMDPLDRDAVCLHLAVLVDSKATPKIFETAHLLSKNKSRAELAVYAIGCYYFALANYERAGRYFCRATELDCYFAEAWVGYAHCYAKLEEGEQALNVYRRAMHLFPGLADCSTYVGMQYSRLHQWPIALCFFSEAQAKNPRDPLSLNERAVLHVRMRRFSEAREYLRLALESLPNFENPSEYRDCIVFNLATVLRKLGEYEEALKYYNLYVTCRPNAGHAHCALGFTHHLMGNMKSAIAHYHTALSIKPDSFCSEMLDRALASDFGQHVGGEHWVADSGAASPTPNDVSFSTASRTLRSDSEYPDNSSTHSPHQNVGRSLLF